jgi:hypothetical protein
MSDGQPHLVPPNEHRCRFVKINGARCTQPALRRKELCFDHDFRLKLMRGKCRATTPATFNTVPLVSFVWTEDHHSILHNLNQIATALATGVIDTHQAGAMTSLMRTCLKTLRQMRDIESIEPPVEDYADDHGQPMALPDSDPDDEPDDRHAAAHAVDPSLSFDPGTFEGRDNLQQEMLWTYFSHDIPSGVPSGLDLNWPGRPASYQPPSPETATQPVAESAPITDPAPVAESALVADPAFASESDPAAESGPVFESHPVADPVLESAAPPAFAPAETPAAIPGELLNLNGAAEPEAVTPIESVQQSPSHPITPVESTHTTVSSRNPNNSHTYAKSPKKMSSRAQPPNSLRPHRVQQSSRQSRDLHCASL